MAAKKRSKKVVKVYCPMCGSTRVSKARKLYVCAQCTSRFPKPSLTRVKKKKRPKYIG